MSPSLLKLLDTNKPLDPAFDIEMSKWLPEQYQARQTRILNNQESQLVDPSVKKTTKTHLKGQFCGTSACRKIKGANEVTPLKTKLSNDWAIKNYAEITFSQ